MNKYLKIAVCVATCLAVGYLSGVATQSSVQTWFPTLEKPVFNPPSWVFMPVWTMLYILMGVAAGLVWDKMENDKHEVRTALLFFIMQLALNALWSVLFFALRNPLLALIEIVVLWFMIYETWYRFKTIDKTASLLLVPYLAWVSFAAVLNAGIWWLNRG